MSIEGRDINDGAIIEATERLADGNGNTQFKIKLPSGREINSEWLNPDNVKKALQPWVDAVRANIVGDAEEARLETKRRVQEAAQQRPSIVLPAGLDASPLPPTSPLGGLLSPTFAAAPISSPVTAGSATSNPIEFVFQNLNAAIGSRDYWKGIAEGATQEYIKAIADVERWTNISKALGGTGSNDTNSEVRNTGPNESGGSWTVRPRRGRKPGSKNKSKPDGGDSQELGQQ